METYMFKSTGIAKLLAEYAEAGITDEIVAAQALKFVHVVEEQRTGVAQRALNEDFAKMIESRIRKSIPSWSTSKPKASGTGSTLVKQPGEKQKVASGTITLTSGIKRVIPSNALGQIVQIDSALAELENAGICGGYLPTANSYLDSSLVQFVEEFVESRKPEPASSPVQP